MTQVQVRVTRAEQIPRPQLVLLSTRLRSHGVHGMLHSCTAKATKCLNTQHNMALVRPIALGPQRQPYVVAGHLLLFRSLAFFLLLLLCPVLLLASLPTSTPCSLHPNIRLHRRGETSVVVHSFALSVGQQVELPEVHEAHILHACHKR